MKRSLLFVGVLLAGCANLLGFDEVTLVGDGGVVPGDGSMGGEPGFTLSAKLLSVSLPLDGQSYFEVEVARTGGFAGEVTVAAQTPPSGLSGADITIPAGQTVGEYVAGVTAPLALGDSFELTLVGSAAGVPEASADVTITVSGTRGSLDTTFGGGVVGTVVNGSADDATNYAAHLTSAGTIYTAGYTVGGLGGHFPFIARYLASGAIDPDWNGGAAVTVASYCACTGFFEEPVAVGTEISAKPVWIGSADVAKTGYTPNAVALRYTTAGVADNFYGNDTAGRTIVDISAEDEQVYAGLVLSTDKSAAAGSRLDDTFVFRLATNGYLDTSFATVGYINASFLSGAEKGRAMVEDSTGRLVVLIDGTGASSTDLALIRILDDGTLDTTFGADGAVVVGDETFNETAKAMVLLGDGSIVTLGTTDANGDVDLQLRKFTSSGEPDTSFGASGVATIGRAGSVEMAYSLVPVPDGRLMIAARSGSSDVLVGVRRDGTIDSTFGTDGFQTVLLGGQAEMTGAIYYAPNQLIVFGGDYYVNTHRAILARVWY